MDYEDEHEEYDDGEELSQGKDGLISPHLMLEHVESFRKYAIEREKLSLPWSRMKSLFDDWIIVRKQETEVSDPESVLKSLKRYLTASLKPTQMPLETCFRNVQDYLDRPQSVLMHPDFPVKPPSLINYYCKKHGYATGFGKIKEVADRMKEDQAGRQECEKELAEL
ncbi:hypothetical protein OESDEN_25400, partial [Oesophagostomum dentatum]